MNKERKQSINFALSLFFLFFFISFSLPTPHLIFLLSNGHLLTCNLLATCLSTEPSSLFPFIQPLFFLALLKETCIEESRKQRNHFCSRISTLHLHEKERKANKRGEKKEGLSFSYLYLNTRLL